MDAVTARDFAHSTPRRARHTRRYVRKLAIPLLCAPEWGLKLS